MHDAPTGKVCNHAWRKACIRAGLPTLRFHDLRHTWASLHVQRGTPGRVLQDLGGWATSAMVERYTHLAVPYTAQWAEVIATTAGQAGTQRDRGATDRDGRRVEATGDSLSPTQTAIDAAMASKPKDAP